MILAIFVLLPIITLADEACDLATKLDTKLHEADTVDKVLALYKDLFITHSCTKKDMIFLNDEFRNKTEIHLEVKKQNDYIEAIKERNITNCKLDPETKKIEYMVYYPVQNITAEYHAALHGEDYKIEWEHLCL